MNVGKALYNILSNDAEIVAICGTRVYPEIADQDAALPFIVYKVSDIQPSGTKSGSSSLDTARVDVYCVSEEYGEAMTISDEVRSALDRVGGTYTGVNIQSIDFDTADVEFDSDQRAYIAEATYNVRVMRVGQAPDINIQPLSILTVEEVDGAPSGTVNKLVVSNGSLSISGSTATVTTGGTVTSVNTQTGDVVLDADDISDAATTNKFATQAQLDKVDHLTVTQAVNLDTIESDTATNNAKVGYTDAAVDARIAAASITDLSDTPATLGTNGQVLAVNSGGTALEFVDQSGAAGVQYHGRYDTEAETERSGATATLEVYYTARPDGDGFAESEVSDVGETDTINRTLFYSTKYLADPDTAGDWTEYTTQPADNATFATAKAALLAGLNETDATAETRGTLPLSLKMVRTTTAAVTNLLLDDYPNAAAAFSVRKLDKDYTGNCMRIRRDSDDAETDIGFDSSGDLDTSAISTHGGASACYVTTWYDQSGNSNNATQSTAGSQPQIYNGTAVITENGKPALEFDGSNDNLDVGSSISIGTSDYQHFGVYRIDNSNLSNFHGVVRDITAQQNHLLYSNTGSGYMRTGLDNGFYSPTTSTSIIPIAQSLLAIQYDRDSNASFFIDATAAGTADISAKSASSLSMRPRIGGAGAQQTLDGTIQEFILWGNIANRTGIETDINTYFSIY